MLLDVGKEDCCHEHFSVSGRVPESGSCSVAGPSEAKTIISRESRAGDMGRLSMLDIDIKIAHRVDRVYRASHRPKSSKDFTQRRVGHADSINTANAEKKGINKSPLREDKTGQSQPKGGVGMTRQCVLVIGACSNGETCKAADDMLSRTLLSGSLA